MQGKRGLRLEGQLQIIRVQHLRQKLIDRDSMRSGNMMRFHRPVFEIGIKAALVDQQVFF